MANIIRSDPFQEVAGFEPFRELMGWPRLRRLFQDLPSDPAIKLDVSETESAYRVKADLPGVKKEDIVVDVNGDQVAISAEVKREKEEKKGDTLVHSERYFGRQFRSFTLGQEIDRDKVVAKFADGVLELTLPKGAQANGKRIAIQ